MAPDTAIPAPTPYFSNLAREHGFERVEVEGTLPPGLRGTLYRNGPGLMEQFGRRYDHLFEGDGAVSAFRFEGGEALAASRVVQSRGLVEERAAGRHLGSFAARWPTRIRRFHTGGFKNTANTNVVSWQGGLYALMEGAKPTRLDPDTLDTLGETDLGVIPGTFSAHPHRVPSRNASYNFGLGYGKQTTLDLFELPDAGPARLMARLPLDKPVMLHDFAATPTHLVFFVSPLQLVLWRMLLALGPFQDCYRWAPEAGTEIIAVPIDRPDEPVRFRTDPFLQFHFGGAFDDGDAVVVDYVRYEDSALLWQLGDGLGMTLMDPGTRAPPGTLHRARIDLVARTFRSAPRWDGMCEFPVTADWRGERFQTTFLLGEVDDGGTLRFQITRLEGQQSASQLLPRGHVASEPVVAGASVLTLVYDCFTARSHVLVLDAVTLAVQARVMLDHAVPLTFHGSWRPVS